MCGIAGYIGNSTSGDGFIETAIKHLSHRGPDDSNFWSSPDHSAYLGHSRLSIIDLTDTGRQPMASRCGRYIIVYNGELYNYLELAADLRRAGQTFQGKSDTEVVLAAYQQWGVECLSRFNGMFSFAIWDQGGEGISRSLFLARDRAGEKPLYYSVGEGEFTFASELKAIPPHMRGGLDASALNHYLALGYIPGEYCIAGNVNKLPPAHAAIYLPESCELKMWRWWSLPAFSAETKFSPQDIQVHCRDLLQDSVRLRLRSDVPVGILLSGGLDSSLVTACAAAVQGADLKTFTIGLPGSKLDETQYAEVIASHFKTDHHVLSLQSDSLNVLQELATYVDEPLADSSILPSFIVSKLTRQHVKVALGGDGGDELFGGYSDYQQAFRDHDRLKNVPAPLLGLVANIAGRMAPGIRGRNRLYGLRGGPFQEIIWGSPYFDAACRDRFLDSSILASLGDSYLSPELGKLDLFETGTDPLDSMSRAHFGSILPDDFLVKVDRASMANSLEIRAPFLDHRLIEFAFKYIPGSLKVTAKEGRIIQKRLAEEMLPPQIDLARKQGFSIPIDTWLRESGSRLLEDLDLQLEGVIRKKAVQSLIVGHRNGRANGSRLFSLIMLSIALGNLKERWL